MLSRGSLLRWLPLATQSASNSGVEIRGGISLLSTSTADMVVGKLVTFNSSWVLEPPWEAKASGRLDLYTRGSKGAIAEATPIVRVESPTLTASEDFNDHRRGETLFPSGSAILSYRGNGLSRTSAGACLSMTRILSKYAGVRLDHVEDSFTPTHKHFERISLLGTDASPSSIQGASTLAETNQPQRIPEIWQSGSNNDAWKVRFSTRWYVNSAGTAAAEVTATPTQQRAIDHLQHCTL